MTNSNTRRIVCSALAAALLASATAHAQCEPQQTAKILPTKPGTNFAFWNGDLLLRGDRLFVSNPWTFEAPDNAGAVWVYERGPDDQWSRTAVLVCPDGNPWKMFGTSLASEGDLSVIAAGGWDAWKNDGAYAFVRGPQGDWLFEAKIVPDDWEAQQYLDTVSLSHDTLLLSASGDGKGAAYVFRRSPQGQWSQEAKLVASDAKAQDQFGWSVSLDGDRAAIGMWRLGAAEFYMFERQGTQWTERGFFPVPPFGGEEADGTRPQLAGDTILVTAWYRIDDENSWTQAYVYRRRSEDLWVLEAALAPSDWPEGVPFGGSGSLREETILIGDHSDGGNGNHSGIGYVFARHPDGTWPETARFCPADNGPDDDFGSLVDFDGDHAAILASGDINPDNLRSSVYIYDIPACIPCPADCDGDGSLELFDFLCFVNALNANDPYADCDASGAFDLFDFLCFTNAFNAGC